MTLVGYHDLAGRSAYQPVILAQHDRLVAYVGHHGGSAVNPLTGAREPNGTSILDVTDARRPRLLGHIPGEPGGGAQMARVCAGDTLPRAPRGRFYLLRTYGDSAHEIWDVTDPARPRRVTIVVRGLRGTHKNWWECDTGVAYLVSGAPGWRTHRMTQIWDLGDPATPVFLRDFGLPGQEPGAAGPVPTGLHGAISTGPKGNRVYFGYGVNRDGILQIVDRARLLGGPSAPTPQNLLAPEVGRLLLPPEAGAHTVFPVPGMEVAEFARDAEGRLRDFVIVVSEAVAEQCREARQMVWMVDVTTEQRPLPVATFTVPEASGGFCRRGGRFGAHASNESFSPVYYRRVVFIAHFNAGVRAVDIRDPYHPREIAHYIPAATQRTERRCVTVNAVERCAAVVQTNNVEVDDRGLIYIVDRAGTGLHILELVGDAREAADLLTRPPGRDPRH